MASAKKALEAMRHEPRNVRYADLLKICIAHFGEPRQSGLQSRCLQDPLARRPAR